MENIINIAKNANSAFLKTMNLCLDKKNEALASISKKIQQNSNLIFEL